MHNSSMNNSFHQQFYQMFPVAPPSASSQASSRSTTPVPGPPPPPPNCTMNRHLLQQQQHQHTLQHNQKNNPQKQLPPNPFRGLQIIQMPAIIYPCKVEGWLYIHETYEAARKRLNFPQEKIDASDLSSAEENTKLRKRSAAVDDDSDSDTEQSTVIHETPKLNKKSRQQCSRVLRLPPPPVPTMAVKENASVVPSLVSVSSLNMDKACSSPRGITSQVLPSPTFAIPCSSVQSVQSGLQLGGLEDELPEFVPSDEQHSNGNIGADFYSFQGNNFDQEEGIKSLQRQMNVVTAKLDFALDILRTMMHARSVTSCSDNSSKLSAFCFPLSNMEDFNNLENQLKDTATKNILLDLLASRGGDNVNQITYRIVAWLLSDDIQSQFSIAGKKNKTGQQKRCFRVSRLFTVICDGVKKQPKGSVASDKDVEKAVEYWLKRASKRLQNERSETQMESPEGAGD